VRVLPFDVMMEGAMSVRKKERMKGEKFFFIYISKGRYVVCHRTSRDGCLYVVTTPD